MRQIWITKAGPPQVLQVRDAAMPIPRSGEVRIKVEAAGINFADITGRLGIYRDAPPIPYVPGYEVSGTIDAVAQGVTGLAEGEKVFALTRFGGYSEAVCVPYKQVFTRLDWMDARDAAALPVNYLTAYLMLVVMGSVHSADRVLIHNVGGGVGLAALDICRILGAETFGTASSTKQSFVEERGLNHFIDYRNREYEYEIKHMTRGEGVNVVLDPLGGMHWAKNYRLLRPTGRLIHYGFSSVVERNGRSLWRLLRGLIQIPFHTPLSLMRDNRAVMGINLAHLWDEVDLLRSWMAQIVAWYDEALFRPQIDATYPFNKAADAHTQIESRQNVGKVLLTT